MGFWCQRSGGWWWQLCLGEQMNLSEPLFQPSVDGSPLSLTQQPLQRHENLVSSVANFIKCVRGHKCLHTTVTSACSRCCRMKCLSSRWSKPASHVLPLHCSHTCLPGRLWKNPNDQLTKYFLLRRYFQNPQPSGWKKIFQLLHNKTDF